MGLLDFCELLTSKMPLALKLLYFQLRTLLICLSIATLTASASRGNEIIFSQLSTSNGLASNFVNCVGQSANGYMWVGTQNGLQRYDGYRFTPTFRSGNKNRLPPLPVHQILRSHDAQKLWIRMGQTLGLFNIGDYTFTKVEVANSEILLERYDFKLVEIYDGQMALLIDGYGVLLYNKRNNRFEQNKQVLDCPDDWEPRAIYQDKNNLVWIPSFKGLACFDSSTKQFYTASYNPKRLPMLQMAKAVRGIKNIGIDASGRMFLNSWPSAGSYQTYLLDVKKGKIDSVTHEHDQKSNYYEMLEVTEKNGIVWGFGYHVFNIFDEEEKRFIAFYDAGNPAYGISVSRVYQVFSDRDRNLWVATDNGLYIASILEHGIRNGAASEFKGADITFVAPLAKNKLILGSWGAKISILQYDAQLRIQTDKNLLNLIYRNRPVDLNYDMVWSALERPEANELWLGCQSGRLIKYHTALKRSTFIHDPVFRQATVRAIVKDSQKNIWFGLQNGLLIKKTGQTYKVTADLNHIVIGKLWVDRHQNIWIATVGKGLFYFDTKTEKLVSNYKVRADGKGLSTNHVKDFMPLNDSIMLIACTANLDLLNLRTQQIKKLTIYDGLPQQSITSLQKDDQGFVWMSTVGGICRFDPTKRLFRMYDQKDGLRNSSNLSDLLENSAKLQNGNMIFTGVKNFMIFNPRLLNQTLRPVHPVITEFKLFNSFISVDSIKRLGGITLPHHKNSIAVSFASLSYLQSNKLKYFYKLAGASNNWYKAENGVPATFASLAPGNYTFMVRAQNSDGVFSPTATLKINILPAFWQRWWFVTIMIMIGFLPIYFIYKLRLKRLIEVQKIREKVARDLHDDMGSTLTSINILSVMASTKVDDEPSTVKDYLGRISENSSQMMESMDDIVWSIKSSNDQLPRIAARMREYTANILEPQDIRYEFTSNDNGGNIKLGMDERRNLFLIFKEALNNISKYAQAKNVTIDLNYKKGWLTLQIKDDGIGFDTQHRADGNGLINMRKRTELLKGTISLTSRTNMGTEIFIKMPLT